jgi:hypothetical protein
MMRSHFSRIAGYSTLYTVLMTFERAAIIANKEMMSGELVPLLCTSTRSEQSELKDE